jgi:hypothetical protein
MDNSQIIEDKYSEAVSGIKEEWLTHASNEWYEYIMSLPIELRTTYMVVVFHNQVFNGGMHQYFVNGYGQFAKETVDALIRIGALEKANLLITAFELVNTEDYTDEIFRRKLLTADIKQLFITDELFKPLNNLDLLYYDDQLEDINMLLNKYFNSRVES